MLQDFELLYHKIKKSNLLIPKIIHKVWFNIRGDAEVPAKYIPMELSLKKYHKDWLIYTWKEEDVLELLKRDFSWFIKPYENYQSDMFRVDAIRYFILYKYGGVYVDQDILFSRSMEQMIIGPDLNKCRQNVLIQSKNFPWQVSNFVMAGEPNSKFFSHVLTNLYERSFSIWNIKDTFIGTMSIAGPMFLQNCYSSYQIKKEITLLPYIAFHLNGQEELAFPFENTFDNLYGVHEYHSSWNSNSKKAKDVFRILFGLCLVLLLISLSVKVYENYPFTFVQSMDLFPNCNFPNYDLSL